MDAGGERKKRRIRVILEARIFWLINRLEEEGRHNCINGPAVVGSLII